MPRGNPQNLTPWKKGQSGNPKGRPTKAVEDRFLNMLALKMDEATMEKFVDKMIHKAVDLGEYRSMELLAAYLGGKPVQRTITVDESPLNDALAQLVTQKREANEAREMELMNEHRKVVALEALARRESTTYTVIDATPAATGDIGAEKPVT